MLSIDSIFSEYCKIERWLLVTKSHLKFFLKKQNWSNEKIESELSQITIDHYELLGLGDKDASSEFTRFKRTLCSKSAILGNNKFWQGIDFFNLLETSNSLLIKEFNEKISISLVDLLNKLKDLSLDHKYLIHIGRTHGVFAEPTSFGHQFAVFFSDLSNQLKDLYISRVYVEIVALDFSKVFPEFSPLALQQFVSEDLDLFCFESNFKNIRTCRYINYLGSINNLVNLFNKYSQDFLKLGNDDVQEINLSDSSKKDIREIELLSKKLDSSYEFLLSLSHSESLEVNLLILETSRILVNALKLFFESVKRIKRVVENISVNEEKIKQNLNSSHIYYSQSLLLYLIKACPYSREEVLNDIKNAAKLINEKKECTWLGLLTSDPKYSKYVSESDLLKLLTPDIYLKNLDDVYKKIFSHLEKSKSISKVCWYEWELDYLITKMAQKINSFYAFEKEPVAIISFAEIALVFLGKLLPKLKFPLTINTVELNRKSEDIDSLELDPDLVQSKRVLIVDYSISRDSVLNNFIEKLRSSIYVKDINICCCLKADDFEEDLFPIRWFVDQCAFHDFYAGFGKSGGGSESCRTFPHIGSLI